MEFSMQEYCSGLPFPTPGHLPDPGIKPVSLHLLHFLCSQENSFTIELPGKLQCLKEGAC